METYEMFKQNNAGWGGYFVTEKEMQKNYEIALQVERSYNEHHQNTNEPQIGDVVEFSDGFTVYKHGLITENLYGGSKFGMMCVCENGSSHTNGVSFSTSGGAFHSKHKSLFKPAGEGQNLVWTWGCHGVGASQGIYFHLNVRKWVIPYEPIQARSKVYVRGRNKKDRNGHSIDAVWIENFGEWFNAEGFDSIKAFLAWADYVGYKSSPFNGTFERRSAQRIDRKLFWNKSEVPEGAKPIKAISNGRCVDAYVVSDDESITYFVPNINTLPDGAAYGTKEWEEECELFRKYSGNPLGV